MAQALYFERDFTIAAGDELRLPIDAAFFYVLASDQPTFDIGFDSEPSGQARAGARFEPDNAAGFQEVRMRNRSATLPLTVTVGWGKGRFTFVPTTATVQGAVGVIGSSLEELPNVNVAAGAVASIAPANTSRRFLMVRNTGGAAVFLRSDAVAAESAFELPAGNFASLEAVNEMFCFNPSAGAITVRVQELA